MDFALFSPVAERPDQGPLTEPAADARPRGRRLLFLPRTGRSDGSGFGSGVRPPASCLDTNVTGYYHRLSSGKRPSRRSTITSLWEADRQGPFLPAGFPHGAPIRSCYAKRGRTRLTAASRRPSSTVVRDLPRAIHASYGANCASPLRPCRTTIRTRHVLVSFATSRHVSWAAGPRSTVN